MLFNAQEQDDNGNCCKEGSGEQILPLDHIETVEDVDTYGNGIEDIRRDQGQRNGIFISGINEHENQGDDATGGGSGSFILGSRFPDITGSRGQDHSQARSREMIFPIFFLNFLRVFCLFA